MEVELARGGDQRGDRDPIAREKNTNWEIVNNDGTRGGDCGWRQRLLVLLCVNNGGRTTRGPRSWVGSRRWWFCFAFFFLCSSLPHLLLSVYLSVSFPPSFFIFVLVFTVMKGCTNFVIWCWWICVVENGVYGLRLNVVKCGEEDENDEGLCGLLQRRRENFFFWFYFGYDF